MTLAYLLADSSQGQERQGHSGGQGQGHREGQRQGMDQREEGPLEVELSPEGEEPFLDRAPVDDDSEEDSEVEDDEFADISFQHYVVITHPPGTSLPLFFILSLSSSSLSSPSSFLSFLSISSQRAMWITDLPKDTGRTDKNWEKRMYLLVSLINLLLAPYLLIGLVFLPHPFPLISSLSFGFISSLSFLLISFDPCSLVDLVTDEGASAGYVEGGGTGGADGGVPGGGRGGR